MYLKLAWRNLWRNKKRTFIIVISISFAVLFASATHSFKQGQYSRMIRNTVQFFTGYMQIHSEGFWDDRSIDKCFPMQDSLINVISKVPGVQQVVPRLESFALCSSGPKTKGAMVVGINPQLENELTNLKKKLVDGEYLEAGEHKALLTEGLSKSLGLTTGDTVLMVSQGYHGANAVNKYPIKGIIKYPLPDLNDNLMYLPLQTAQFFYDTQGLITGYSFLVENNSVEEAMLATNQSFSSENFEVMDWKEMLPDLVQTIEFDRTVSKMILTMLYVIIGFGIMGTFFMMVYERNYEFAMLLASGMNTWRLIYTFTLELILIALVGSIVGVIVSVPVITYYFYNPIPVTGDTAIALQNIGIEPFITFSLSPQIFINQVIVVVAITLLLGMYPVLKLRKLKVVESIKG